MSTPTTTRPAVQTAASNQPSLWRASLRPAGIAVVAAGLVFLIADTITGGLIARQGTATPEPIMLAHVLGATVIGSKAAVAIAWGARRYASHPRRTFVTLTAGGAILYSVMPFIATEELATALVLVLLHVVVAVPLIAGLRAVLPDSR